MNPHQELTLTKILIGAVRGYLDALMSREAEFAPHASAYHHTVLHHRAIHQVREEAAAYGINADAAEQHYWDYISDGHGPHAALGIVSAELRAA